MVNSGNLDILLLPGGGREDILLTLGSFKCEDSHRIFLCLYAPDTEIERELGARFKRRLQVVLPSPDNPEQPEAEFDSNRAALVNKAIDLGNSQTILTIEPGISIDHEFIGRGLRALDSGHKIGQVACRIEGVEQGGVVRVLSAGLGLDRCRRTYDPLDGRLAENSDLPGISMVFGASWRCGFFRRESLLDLQSQGEFFDTDFINPKADVDLAWRAQLRGWKTIYNPFCRALDNRFGRQTSRTLAPEYRLQSCRNRYVMILKNDTAQGLAVNFFRILTVELALQVYLLFFEPSLLKWIFQIVGKLPEILRKRRDVQKRRRMTAQSFEKSLELFLAQHFPAEEQEF